MTPEFDPQPGERLVYLSRGYAAIINEVDWPLVEPYNWFVFFNYKGGNIYAKAFPKGRALYMHRLITSCPKGLVVDHRNGTGLDNRRRNLSVTTKTFNNHNADATNGTGYRGVQRRPNGRSYYAQISFKGERRYLGDHTTAELAAAAYDAAALELFGPFAWTNAGRAVDQIEKIEDVPF